MNRAAAALALLLLFVPLSADTQTPASESDRWRFALGGALGTPLVEDGNGVTVRPGPAITMAVGRVIHARHRRRAVLALSSSASALRIRSSGAEWSGGSVVRFDLGVQVEQPTLAGLVASLDVAASHLVADHDVIPFRDHGSLTTWSAGVALGRELDRRRRLDLVLAADVLRMRAQAAEDPGLSSGWAGRVRLAVRHAR